MAFFRILAMVGWLVMGSHWIKTQWLSLCANLNPEYTMKYRILATIRHKPKGQSTMFLIIDCKFNRAWYPELIGQIVDEPPTYAAVRVIN